MERRVPKPSRSEGDTILCRDCGVRNLHHKASLATFVTEDNTWVREELELICACGYAYSAHSLYTVKENGEREEHEIAEDRAIRKRKEALADPMRKGSGEVEPVGPEHKESDPDGDKETGGEG